MRPLPFALLALLVAACGGSEPPPLDPLDGWTLEDQEIGTRSWRASLRGPDREPAGDWIDVVVPDRDFQWSPPRYAPGDRRHVRLFPTPHGPIVVYFQDPAWQQHDYGPGPVSGQLLFWHHHEQTGTEIRISRRCSVEMDSTREYLFGQALDDAESDPALVLMKLLVATENVLDERVVPTGYDTVEVSVNGGPPHALDRIRVRGGRGVCFALPARPGDRVRITVRDACAERVVVTSRGIYRERATPFPTGVTVSLGKRRATYNAAGAATFDEFRLDDPRRIRLSGGTIYLRWGRPHEGWLDACDFPLARPEEGAETRALLDHLEAAWNGDLEYLLKKNGSSHDYDPSWPEVAALAGLDLTDYPRLTTLRDGIPAGQAFADFCGESGRAPLTPAAFVEWRRGVEWFKVRHRKTKELRWRSARAAHALSVLHEHRSDLRSDNVLPEILAYWKATMPTHPDPVDTRGKADSEILRLESRLLAIAVLRRAAAAGDAECAALAEAQVKRAKEVAEEIGVGWALREQVGIRNRWKDRIAREVGVYGQICRLIGDEKGLEAAQAWVRAALHRKGGEEGGPFANYRRASFGDRLVLLGMMNGKTSLLTPPPLK